MSAAEWNTLLVAGTAVLTVLLTKGIDALLKLRADGRIDKIRLEQGIDSGLKLVIERQDARIAVLEKMVTARELEHEECLKSYAQLKEMYLAIKFRLDALEKKDKQRDDDSKGEMATHVTP